MTSLNRQDFIAEAIESVLVSSYDNFELIIVDDCSSDLTVEIAREFAVADRRVHVHINQSNLGDYPNRNRAAELARGKYIKYLDSDDILYAHGLAVMVDCMERHPAAGYGLSQAGYVDHPHPTVLGPRDAYREHFLQHDLFGRSPGSAIIRTDVFRGAGGFSGKRQVGDHEFWLKLSRSHAMVTMPRDLVWDRTHAGQEQGFDTVAEKARMHRALDLAALDHPDCPLSPAEKVLAMKRLRRGDAATFWRLVVREHALREGMEFRRKLDLDWATVIAAPFSSSASLRPTDDAGGAPVA